MSPVSVSFILKFFYVSTKCFLLQAELLKVLDALLQALPCSGTLTCVHMLPTGDILGTGQHLTFTAPCSASGIGSPCCHFILLNAQCCQ